MSSIVIFEGPDGCGKTEVSTAFSKLFGYQRFKATTERENWDKLTFKNSLAFDLLVPQFVEQTGARVVLDRSYPSEWVYSGIFNRETDYDMIDRVDEQFANLGAHIFILVRSDYSKSRDDELVQRKFLPAISDRYWRFSERTRCYTSIIDVSRCGDDLTAELNYICRALISPQRTYLGDRRFLREG